MQTLLFITPRSQIDKEDLLSLLVKQTSNVSIAKSDVLEVSTLEEKKSIGIDQARLVKNFVSVYPQPNSRRVVVVQGAEKLTLEAQNALLKILEEPPELAAIILVTNNQYSLQTTIRSRCKMTNLPLVDSKKDEETMKLYQKISKAGISQKLQMSDDWSKSKTKPLDTMDNLIKIFRYSPVSGKPSSSSVYNLTLTLYTRKLLLQNINTKLVLDNFLVKLR